MKYNIKNLEKLSNENLIMTYRDANKLQKKQILIALVNNQKFDIIMNNLTPDELIQMVKIHPYKEAILDTMLDNIESYGDRTQYYFKHETFDKLLQEIQKGGFFNRLKCLITGKSTLSQTLSEKIRQVEKIYEYKSHKMYATGKKIEQCETQDLDKAVDEARVELNSGEMANIFDKCVYQCEKNYYGNNDVKKFIDKNYGEGSLEKYLLETLEKEYISIIGDQKTDIAKLVAKTEIENLRKGHRFFNPYSPRGIFGNYYFQKDRSGPNDTREWKKNLLEVEKVNNFDIKGQNLGIVYIVKSEIQPTAYAMKEKWAPIYEYYKDDKDKQFICIGSGKISETTGKMETTISADGTEISYHSNSQLNDNITDKNIIKFNSNEYTGESTKISRKDIEQKALLKEIGEYIGKDKIISDVTQVKDIPIIKYDDKGNAKTKNAYLVDYLENGIENFEMVYIDENCKCHSYPEMNKDILFKQKNLCFHNETSEDSDKKTSLWTFKSKDESKYSVYRDNEEKLRIAKFVECTNENKEYADALDTYAVVHEDLEKIKNKSKEQYRTIKQKDNQISSKIQKDDDNSMTL